MFYTFNEIFKAKTPWKKLFSQRNSMNFLYLLGLWYVQPKSGFLIIMLSEMQGLVQSVIQWKTFIYFNYGKEGQSYARTTWDNIFKSTLWIWPIENLQSPPLHPFTPKFLNTQYSGLQARLPRPNAHAKSSRYHTNKREPSASFDIKIYCLFEVSESRYAPSPNN